MIREVKKENRQEVPWGLLDVAKATFLLILIFFVFGAFLAFLREKEFLVLPEPLGIFFFVLISYGVLILVVWNYSIKNYKANFKDLGMVPFSFAKALYTSALWMILIILFSILESIVMELLKWKPPVEMGDVIVTLFGTDFLGLTLFVVLAVIIAPVAEEIFFRGFIYSALRKRIGTTGGILTSSLLFALAHADLWYTLPTIFVIGVILAYLYEKKRTLVPSIFLHSANNLLSSVIFIYGVYLGR